MSLPDLIQDQLKRIRPIPRGLVVGVSGGADSVALLRALLLVRHEAPLGPIVIAHLNHGLRGLESDGDEQFVRDLHRVMVDHGEHDLHLTVRERDVGKIARKARGNLEAVARRERYQFFSEAAAEFKVNGVATAHTADDQAETVLHRLLRGTGLQGLRGTAPRRQLRPGLTLIRPMLRVTRAAILAFLAKLKQDFREDRSNADRRYTRNRIRHELLPLLAASYNPAIVQVLVRLSEQAADLFDEVQRRAVELLQTSECPPAGALRILRAEPLAAAPRNLCREALRQLWQREGWPRDGMRRSDWDRVAAVAAGELVAADLPGRIRARRKDDVLQIGPRGEFGTVR